MSPAQLIDRSLKLLFRRVSPALFRLARLSVDPAAIRLADVSVNLPEHRADQLFLTGADDDPRRWALHLEYQLQPDRRALRSACRVNPGRTYTSAYPGSHR
jgi:hypothetical protein